MESDHKGLDATGRVVFLLAVLSYPLAFGASAAARAFAGGSWVGAGSAPLQAWVLALAPAALDLVAGAWLGRRARRRGTPASREYARFAMVSGALLAIAASLFIWLSATS